MPIKVQSDLPVKEILEKENLFVMDERRALSQEIRPLQICILNLMPIKEDTELQLLRALSNSPLQVDITFMKLETHTSLNTSYNHLHKFYQTFAELRKERYDGLIITGAPVEQMPFEEVDYWEELCQIMEWSKSHVTSTFHICWGAQAGLYYHYGLEKELLPKKMFGIFSHRVFHRKEPIVRGFDDVFLAPHSRHTTVNAQLIHECSQLKVLAESEEAGVLLMMAGEGAQIFVMGHLEYDRLTLDQEYKRDQEKGLPIELPVSYYPDDDSTQVPTLTWRSHCNNLYANWLNIVYQITPYEL